MENILDELIAELNALKINNRKRTGDYRIGLTHAIEAVQAKKSVLNLYSVSFNEANVCQCTVPYADDDKECCRICGKFLESEVEVCERCNKLEFMIENGLGWDDMKNDI